jgi:hypothetical protein
MTPSEVSGQDTEDLFGIGNQRPAEDGNDASISHCLSMLPGRRMPEYIFGNGRLSVCDCLVTQASCEFFARKAPNVVEIFAGNILTGAKWHRGINIVPDQPKAPAIGIQKLKGTVQDFIQRFLEPFRLRNTQREIVEAAEALLVLLQLGLSSLSLSSVLINANQVFRLAFSVPYYMTCCLIPAHGAVPWYATKFKSEWPGLFFGVENCL